jgi:hypothetical protein
MTFIIDLPVDQVAALEAKAASVGLSLEGWLLKLAENGDDTSMGVCR